MDKAHSLHGMSPMPQDDLVFKQKLEKALLLQQNNAILAAKQLFEEILLQAPNQEDALNGLGLIYAEQRDFQKAVHYLSQAVNAAPSIAEFHNNLGNAYKAVGKVEDAIRHYHEALRLKSPYPQAHNNLGALLYRIGSYDNAARHFEKAIRMNPKSADFHYNLANCYIQLDRLLDASTHYQEVLKMHPEHLGALHNLGITLCALKHFEAAKPLLEQVIEREPTNIDALFHLGVIYSALAQASAAKMCYEKVLALDFQHANAHHNLATIYLHLNEPQKALEHYQAALKYQPQNKTAEHMIAALTGKTMMEGAPYEYTRALFDQYAYSYDQHVRSQLKYQIPQALRTLMTPYLANIYTAWDVLDLGCGTGLCAPLFSDIAGKLFGIDVSSNMIEVARQRGGYFKLEVIDAQSYLSKHLKAFDLIIGADVFVYFGSLEAIFTACYHSLKNEGYLCFSIEKLTEEEIKRDPDHPLLQLRKTGRFAHCPAYIRNLATTNHFALLVEHSQIIRYQETEPVMGNLYILKKIAHSS